MTDYPKVPLIEAIHPTSPIALTFTLKNDSQHHVGLTVDELKAVLEILEAEPVDKILTYSRLKWKDEIMRRKVEDRNRGQFRLG